MTFDEVLAEYPYRDRDDLLIALEYGAVASGITSRRNFHARSGVLRHWTTSAPVPVSPRT